MFVKHYKKYMQTVWIRILESKLPSIALKTNSCMYANGGNFISEIRIPLLFKYLC